MSRRTAALDYHANGRPGKLEVRPTKPCLTQTDLSLAYSPGVAEPCLEIAKNPDDVYRYTGKGNTVAVVSNGTAVLGLGNIGPLASKPVMEGKGVLFKRFADIDVYDIELDVADKEQLVEVVAAMAPTFGGINLEDIAAPDCFYVERELQKRLDIPVFHDDQHGTAIISAAALINAAEITGRKLEEVKVVLNGAGAAGIATAELYQVLGVRPENMLLCDSKGVIHAGRMEGLNAYKATFARDVPQRTLADAMVGADVFVGCSVADVVTQDMVRSMADKPIIFALANPDPEITPELALEARPDAIVATGRSDYPNQVNNVLGFPFLFRGALDVRARGINDEMKKAAVEALAALAKEPVPESVLIAYGLTQLSFGPQYIIPKPFDRRVPLWVAPAVAEAAVKSECARLPYKDRETYRAQLRGRLQGRRDLLRPLRERARMLNNRIIFPEGENRTILRAANYLAEEKLCRPILLARPERLRPRLEELGLTDLEDRVEFINPLTSSLAGRYADALYERRHRRGLTRRDCIRSLVDPNVFGALMVELGDAEGMVSGVSSHYQDVVRPALQIIGTRDGQRASGVYIVQGRDRLLFFGDCTMTISPDAQTLASTARDTARVARLFDVEPRVAMLSYSNFGSARHEGSEAVAKAVRLLRDSGVDFEVDGEMQADLAFNTELREKTFPFCNLSRDPNVLVFPNLDAANIAYKLLESLGGMETIGPLLVGMNKPVNALQLGCSVASVVSLAVITAVEPAIGAL